MRAKSQRIPCDRHHVDLLVQILRAGDGPITAPKIQAKLGFHSEQTSQSTRSLVTFAIEVCKVPIVSSTSGYWIAKDSSDVAVCLDSLGHRIEGLRKRQKAIADAWSSWKTNLDPQITLF